MFEKLDIVKPALKNLVSELRKKYAYASVLAVQDDSRAWRINRAGKRINNVGLGGGSGYVVRVFDQIGCAEYSFNEFSEEKIPEIVKTIEERIAHQTANVPDGIKPLPTPIPSDETATLKKVSGYAIDPRELGDEKILERLDSIRNKTLSVDGVLDAMVNVSYRKFRKLFISENRDLDQTVMWTNGAIVALALRGEEVKDAYKGFSQLGGAEILDRMEEFATEVANKAIELLSSEQMIPGEYDCICDPDTTGMIVHEAFGHGVEMDMFVKDRALAKSYMNKQVASSLVTMHDNAATCNECGSYFFDDEGMISNDTVIIEKGILKSGINDLQSAYILNVSSTGNGRRESYERKAYTRKTNTYFEPGTDTLEEMIKSIRYGFLLENAASGMEDPKNWGIQCMVNIGREIKDGKLTVKIFSPIFLSGYVTDFLKSITMISDKLELSGCGYCGKGYKEWVKVSDGGSAIKARVKIS